MQQLSTLVHAAIPLVHALDILIACQTKPILEKFILTVKQDIESGQSFSHSVIKYPYFDALTKQLIQIGEQLGQLENSLSIITQYLDKQAALKKKLMAALYYPMIIVISAVLITISLLLFVVPHFIELFHAKQQTLPLLTRGIFFLSSTMQTHLTLLMLILIGAMSTGYWHRHALRQHWQQKRYYLLKHLPFIRQYAKQATLLRFTRQLAISLTGGLSLAEALSLVKSTHQDHECHRLFNNMHFQVLSGLSLHQTMATIAYFPAMMVQMVRVGEEASMLEHMLHHIANTLETSLELKLNQLSQLIEPITIILLGILIGGLVMGMYLPIFHLGSII